MHGGVVEPLDRLAELGRLGVAVRAAAGNRLVQRDAGGFLCRQPGGEQVSHAPHPADVGRGVQPVPGFGPRRRQQSVAALPGAQELGRDARAPRQLADSQLRRFAHEDSVQTLDRDLTDGAFLHLQSLDKP